jgi:glutathione S-transferase
VAPASNLPQRIYHLALRDEWQGACGGKAYRRSTLGRSLADVGFIHCSFAHQVQAIADLVYNGRGDVVLLEIDPSRVQAEVRVEDLEAGGQTFPHIYGPLPIEAVTQIVPNGVSEHRLASLL